MSADIESTDQLKGQIAEFMSAALKIPDSRELIVQSLQPVREDIDSGIYVAELESPQIGDAAFLIYYYDKPSSASGDATVETSQFEIDLQTLHTSADLDLPGPRLLAHAATDTHAFILATTPETYRALAGEPETPELPTDPEALAEIRREAAIGLLLGLREANKQAKRWLAAVGGGSDTSPEALALLEVEIALAMHVADGANVQDLLHVLNLFVELRRQRTADQSADEPDSPPT